MSAVVLDELKCGECGSRTFELLHKKHPDDCRFGGGSSIKGQMIVVCARCKDRTVLGVSAELTVSAEGCLCGGWRE